MVARDPVLEAARTGEPDRYLSALYASEPARGRLMALAAFAAGLARISSTIREPMLIEIRLQWWRDALVAGQRGEATGHPVADRLAPDVASGILPLGLLLGMADAAPRPDLTRLASDAQALRAQLNKSEGAAFALAARALGAAHSAVLDEACQRAGFGYGLARLAVSAPPVAADLRARLAAQCRDALPGAAAAVRRLDTALLPAFLPLTMSDAYLRHSSGAAMPLLRWWTLWRANLRGRVL